MTEMFQRKKKQDDKYNAERHNMVRFRVMIEPIFYVAQTKDH